MFIFQLHHSIAGHIAGDFNRQIEKVAFRLELKMEKSGTEKMVWHGLVDGEKQTFNHEPWTDFRKRPGGGRL